MNFNMFGVVTFRIALMLPRSGDVPTPTTHQGEPSLVTSFSLDELPGNLHQGLPLYV
jgi:hypothetical protein